MDAEHFNKYTFQTFTRNSTFGQAGAYYYGKVRKKEKKFYILCQDYSFGHSLADEFKIGLKKYFPEAEIVGEDYHPLFAKDFAPYVTKIKASGAEVIYTGDWLPDGGNMLKTARDMGVNIPVLNIFIDEPNALHAIGVEGTKGLVNMNHYMGDLTDPARAKFNKAWNDLWANKWQKPYNTWLYKWPGGTIGDNLMVNYWLMSVLERAGSLDLDKITEVWEGDEFQTLAGVLKMRADDHTAVRDMYIKEQVGETHSHGSEGEHVHYGTAFTTWLDFTMASAQAEAVKNALMVKRPAHKEYFKQNFEKLQVELQALDYEMAEVARGLPQNAIYTSHPVYQYMGRAYDMSLISEHWEPGEKPNEKQWQEFKHKLEHDAGNLMLWEAEPDTETVNKLKALKVESVVYNPCGNIPARGDFISVMKQNIKNLKNYVEQFC
jgi:ABC-type Zn uptake system ZnuABC Zn-binding protein ZnuA